MATSHGALQDRLCDAISDQLVPIVPEEDLPPHLRAKFNELMERVSRIPDPNDTGALAATFAQMSDEEASEVARVVSDLNARIESTFDAEGD